MYQLEPAKAVFDGEFATQGGWATIHTMDPETGEYTGAHFEYVPEGQALSAGSFLDAPTPEVGKATIRTDEGWRNVADMRGRRAWLKETAEPVIIEGIGELDPRLTLDEPGPNDIWDNGWKVDLERVQASLDYDVQDALRLALSKIDFIKADILLGEAEEADLVPWIAYLKALKAVKVVDGSYTLPKEP